MSKLKPNKGVLKRIKITATGKIKHRKAGKSHLNSHMTGTRIRQLRQDALVKKCDIPRAEGLLKRPLRGV